MSSKYRGFTIVELLIVIVVIAILAAISIVAYNGIQERARFSTMRSDMASLNKAIQLYYAQNGSYPLCAGWCGYNQATGDSFIPGLVPEFVSATPQLPTENGTNDTYLYRSVSATDGTNYKLIRYYAGGLPASEGTAMMDLRTICSPATTPQSDRWGYWSSETSRCW